MLKQLPLIMISTTSLAFAAQIYSAPSVDATVIADVNPEHEYTIKTQDWVEVIDRSSQDKGWAQLSELKSSLSTNSQWSYQWHSTHNGSQQTMHYQPFSSHDIEKQVSHMHQQHKRIMSQFQQFWDDLDQDLEHTSTQLDDIDTIENLDDVVTQLSNDTEDQA